MEEKAGFSRRDFLRGSGMAMAGALAATTFAGCSGSSGDGAIAEAKGHIDPNPAKCSGCRTCMIVCSLSHYGEVSMGHANLRITQASQNAFETSILTCKQCETPDCYYACQEKGSRAMFVDKDSGARVIDSEKCSGCLKCIEACPQYPKTPIFYDKEKGVCHKCDLCGGDPQCVKFCPMSLSLSEHCYPADEHPLTYTGVAK